MTVRSFLYCFARFLGDVNAIRRGPKAVIKREVRKVLLRTAGKAVQRMVK